MNTIASCNPFRMTKDSRADMNQLPLAAILVDKVHNNVASTQEAPRDSVVETGV